ncbi:malto-oligosyltrehalose trehalohydrolase [Chryseolinea lacunae]|uniref:Malto-oligosyltrehalose trehalohydrolase n=1 Tax=Chryseolinea lacunae TaxID=2801331 RepID=A0ABS1KMZ3_9BACT|nr:malto-oligosyltrehalose trehalohydrolase [Chryseolinea lacunae]MBL0740593.1 malto-oligosyltrehalose trehalohydrolase [Chryseolinea lacunae]
MRDLADTSRRSLGVTFREDGRAVVRLWAPTAKSVSLKLKHGTRSLLKQEHGFWELVTADMKPGDAYQFLLDEKLLPDPASLSQPDGVHGPSQAIDIADFGWTDTEWANPNLADYILYELHVGTFTDTGTFDAVITKLPHLKSLGITALEIMPVSQFPGDRNWGYDGVFPFAVHHCYGGARGLQRLVDACHRHGLAVVLDVVYNHVGPEGNYLREFGPYFTKKYNTPWGDAINFDDAGCDGVRYFFIENALMWLRDFHIDALRLDAVHAIRDFSPVHILEDIRRYTTSLICEAWRRHYLLVELDLNDTRFIHPARKGGYGMDGQWIDEFHHALRVTTGQARTGYYEDFDGVGHLAKAYRDAYVYDGQYSTHRQKYFGVKADGCAGEKFVVFSQNHDQVGNRMMGERTSTLVSFELLKVMAGAVLLSPYLPLLFMGEEYGETNPFLYFVHHGDAALIEAVRRGRRAEFASFQSEGEAPDPQAQETFLRSRLQWSLLENERHHVLFAFYQELIVLRKSHNALRYLNRTTLDATANEAGQTLLLHRWHGPQHVWCAMNFSELPQPFLIPEQGHLQKVLDSGDARWQGLAASPDVLLDGNFTLPSQSLVVYTARHD